MGRLLWNMRIDRVKLVPVVLVDLVASRQDLIVHAGVGLSSIVIQAEGVTDLLTRNMVDSSLRVTRRISHVCVIDL